MGWFVLKDRKYEGPFNEEQLLNAFLDGRLKAKDFVISEENVEKGQLKYVALEEVKGLKGICIVPARAKKAAETPERELETFGEESSGEVSRLFAEAFEPVEFVAANQPARENATGATIIAQEDTTVVKDTGPGWRRPSPRTTAAVVAVFALLVLGAFYFVNKSGGLQNAANTLKNLKTPAQQSEASRLRPSPAGVAPKPAVPTSPIQLRVPPPPPPPPEVRPENNPEPPQEPETPYVDPRDVPAPIIEPPAPNDLENPPPERQQNGEGEPLNNNNNPGPNDQQGAPLE